MKCVVFSPNGKYLLTGSGAKDINIVDIKKKVIIKKLEKVHKGNINTDILEKIIINDSFNFIISFLVAVK